MRRIVRIFRRLALYLSVAALGFVLGALALYIYWVRSGPTLELWHTEQLEEEYADPVERMQRVLVNRENLPFPISRLRNPGPTSSTLAGIIMDLTRNRFILTNGAPHMSPWISLPGV